MMFADCNFWTNPMLLPQLSGAIMVMVKLQAPGGYPKIVEAVQNGLRAIRVN